MKFSYGDNYFIRKENYVTGYKANSRLFIYAIVAVVYSIIEWQMRKLYPESDLLLYIGLLITAALVILLSVLFTRKLLRSGVFDIGIVLLVLFSLFLLISNIVRFVA